MGWMKADLFDTQKAMMTNLKTIYKGVMAKNNHMIVDSKISRGMRTVFKL